MRGENEKGKGTKQKLQCEIYKNTISRESFNNIESNKNYQNGKWKYDIYIYKIGDGNVII